MFSEDPRIPRPPLISPDKSRPFLDQAQAEVRGQTQFLVFSLASRYYLDMLRFEWDERKNKRNRTKHGIWFEEAQSVFSDPHARLFYDPEHSEGEERFVLLGVSSAERMLVVVHCYRESDSLIRIISARKATRKEARFYEEGV